MARVTIDIPDELKELKKASKIQWQSLVQRKLNEEFERLAEVKRIISKSKMTQEQADALSDEVNWAVAKRHEAYLKKMKGKV